MFSWINNIFLKFSVQFVFIAFPSLVVDDLLGFISKDCFSVLYCMYYFLNIMGRNMNVTVAKRWSEMQ